MSEVSFDPFAGGEILRVSPTTAPQQEIITSSKMSDEANTAFNEGVSLTIIGSLDFDLLKKCCNTLIERHDILRATFSSLGDEICLQEAWPVLIPFEDLRSYKPEERRRIVDELLQNIAISPMNLEEGPLFFAWVKQFEDERFELIIVVHHVICDGWSIGLLLTELAELYRNDGNPKTLANVSSYFDFSDQSSASQVSNVDVDYWIDRFQNLPPTLDLPLDMPRPALRSFRANRYDYHFDKSLVSRLPKAASAQKCSLVNYILAAYFALLYRLTGNEDIVVGLPVAGQAALNQLAMVGHMVQLLPIRIHLDGDTTFSNLVAAVKREVLNASEHPNFTFGQLLENISVERSRVPLISTIFNIDQPMPLLDFGSASASVASVPRAAENFEIFLNIMPSADDLVVEATYSSALFSEDTMVSWMRSLEAILQSATTTPDISIGNQPLSDGIPQELQISNRTVKSGQFLDMLSAFKFQVQQRPDSIAVISGSKRLSYSDLDFLSSQCAAALLDAGVQMGSVVGVCCDRSESLLIGTLAIQKLGAIYLPLDPDFPTDRLLYMLDDSGATAVLEDDSTPQAVREAEIKHLNMGDLVLAGVRDVSIDLPDPSLERAAYTIYTSGSTGKPKGVRIQNGALINFLESMADRPGCTESDTLLAVTTLSFDISVLELFLPLVTGATTLIASRDDVKDGERLAVLLKEGQVTIMQATPSTWRMLLTSEWGKDKSRRQLKALCGGEPLPQDLALELVSCVSELWNMFGPTETTVWSTCKKIQESDALITIGRPIANTQVYVLDDNLNPLPVSVPGELCIGGAGVSLGYHQRPALNDDRFVTHPVLGRIYRTGDLAKALPNGEIQHLGRLDDQVKLRGYRIELGEIEMALKSCVEVEQAVVYLLNLGEQDVRVVACCVPVADRALETISIRKKLRECLPSYMVPQYFLSISKIPLTPNGKVDRRSLPRPEMSASSILGAKVLQTDSEKLIASVWSDLLKIGGAIGREDNFFELGGHSLLALQAIRQIEIASGARLKPADIVVDRLSALAEKITSAAPVKEQVVVAPVALPQFAARQLSQEQSRLLERQLKHPDNTCNNLPAAWLLEGEMNLAAFSKSVERVVERQTALRTVITPFEQGYQLVLRHMSELEMPTYRDFSNETDPMSAVLSDARQRGLLPFSVINETLCNILLYKISAEKHLLVIAAHQLVFDGWSFDIFLGELEAYYRAALENRAAVLDPLSFQFRDYTEWVACQPTDSEALSYHRKAIDLGSQVSSLVNSEAAKDKYTRRELYFDGDILDKIETFCELYQVRLHEVLLALFAKACSDAEKRNNLVIGLPVSGRYMPDVIGLVGGFVSTLPMEVNVRTGDLGVMVTDIAAQLRIFYDHQELSYAQLVADTPLEKQWFPACLPISFAFQDIRNRPQALADLKLSQIDMERQETEVPLEFWTRIHAEGFVMVFDYDSGQVESATIENLAAKISAFVANIDKPGDSVPQSTSEMVSDLPQRPFWRRLFQ
ncbi:peptide synthetase [marine gamma proteobacterium HTCC2143]|uniref:Peptide synthetase n=1 Tax=marine gamma proteobacterium HTCC2143 TaxID=247633 RepID=A0YGI5_9GAMM|nr:peptide synthetase [marine gamma proteobacterium HTCC2143]